MATRNTRRGIHLRLMKVDDGTTNSPGSLTCRVIFPRVPPTPLFDYSTDDFKTENDDALFSNNHSTRTKIKVTAPCLPKSSSESLLDSPKPTVVKQPRSDARNGDIIHHLNGRYPAFDETTPKKKNAAVAQGCKDGTRRRKKTSRSTAAANHGTAANHIAPGHVAAANHLATSNHIACNRIAMVSESTNGLGENGVCGSPRGRSSSVPAIGTPQKCKLRVTQQNQLMTDFFPIRRSSRTTSTQLKKREKQEVEEHVLSGREEGLKVVQIAGKGRGVVTRRRFSKGEYLVEYAGELVDRAVAKDRDAKYSTDQRLGCYMYYFNYRDRGYCVDATAETSRLGRLINHSRLNPNCTTKIIELAGEPRLILVALRDLDSGEELLYDYGDRDRETLGSHPWLAL